jgi:hypothetical protein
VNLSDWDQIKHFTSHEFSDPDKMVLEFVLELDAWRDYLGSEVLITASTDGEHVDGSYHYLGLAVDIMCLVPGTRTLLDFYFSASRFGFTGIGLYPDWRYNNKVGQIVKGGLHLDLRPLKPREKRALWMGVKLNGTQTYLPLTEANLLLAKAIG